MCYFRGELTYERAGKALSCTINLKCNCFQLFINQILDIFGVICDATRKKRRYVAASFLYATHCGAVQRATREVAISIFVCIGSKSTLECASTHPVFALRLHFLSDLFLWYVGWRAMLTDSRPVSTSWLESLSHSEQKWNCIIFVPTA